MPIQPGYTRGEVFLTNISSFWRLVFKQADLVQALLDNTEETLAQAYFNLLEIILTQSLDDIPVFHREKWQLLTFNESDKNRNTGSLLQFGDGVVFGDQPVGSEFGEGLVFEFGGFAPGAGFSFQLPEGMVSIESYVVNRIHEPSLVLTRGSDFLIKHGVIVFREDPFLNELVPTRTIQDSAGVVVDKQLALWALNSDHDYQFLWKNYGYLIDVFLESSDNYKQFLRAAWELFNKGPRITFLVSTLNALLGLPTIIENEETVELVLEDDGVRRVVTDKHVYEFALDVPLRPDLETGLVLEASAHISNVVEIFDNIQNPGWWTNFEFLPIPKRILGPGHENDLIVFNDPNRVPLAFSQVAPLKVGGRMTEERLEFYANFPIIFGDHWRWGDTHYSYLSLDLVFRSFLKFHLFLLRINLDHVQAQRLSNKVVELLHDSLPAYVFYIALNEITEDDTYNLETEAEDGEFDFERAWHFKDDFSAIDDGYMSRTPLLFTLDTFTFTTPAEFLWGEVGFHGGGPRWFIRPKPCAT
jgi:hypothetical protein